MNNCQKCGRPLATVEDIRKNPVPDGMCWTGYMIRDPQAQEECDRVAKERPLASPLQKALRLSAIAVNKAPCTMHNNACVVCEAREALEALPNDVGAASPSDVVDRLMNYDTCHDGDVDEAAKVIKELREQNQELEAGFELRWNADMRAIKRWRAATGRTMTLPDHADLCVWLMERLAQHEDVLRSLASYLGVGGYNAETVDAAKFEEKIRDGIDAITQPLLEHLLQAEKKQRELNRRAQAAESRNAREWKQDRKLLALRTKCLNEAEEKIRKLTERLERFDSWGVIDL